MNAAAEEAKKEAARQAVILASGAVSLVIYVIVTQPDTLRKIRMRASRMVKRLAEESAKRAGHSSMGTELRTGVQEYRLPYWLSKVRDRAAFYYERSRES